jgi:hypothetical protein
MGRKGSSNDTARRAGEALAGGMLVFAAVRMSLR